MRREELVPFQATVHSANTFGFGFPVEPETFNLAIVFDTMISEPVSVIASAHQPRYLT